MEKQTYNIKIPEPTKKSLVNFLFDLKYIINANISLINDDQPRPTLCINSLYIKEHTEIMNLINSFKFEE